MKYAITGHSKNIGKFIFDKYHADAIGFSRQNGYDINNKNINELLKNYDFKKDTQIIHIAIHHNIEHKLKELDDYTQTNTIYKELLESRIYDLHKLSDYADVIVEEVNKYSSYEKNSDNIYLLLKEVQCLLYKYN
jgi:hypothetical protein